MTDTPARPDKLAELHARLADEVAALQTGQDWQRWLAAAARFHEYSFQNTLLIVSQRPDATSVAGYETWKALGRQVNRGEKGIAILAPVLRRRADPAETRPDPTVESPEPPEPDGGRAAGRVLAGFRVTYVWDVSQTTGPPLAEPPTPQALQGRAPDGLWDAMAGLVTGTGFTLDRGPAGGANGITDFGARTVRVRADVDDAHAVKTLAHELGHVRLHAPDGVREAAALSGGLPCRGLIEVEAESVAYLVTGTHGMDTGGYTFPYVLGWASDVPGHAPEDVVRITGERVLSAARWILSATETAVPTTEAPRPARVRERATTTPRAAESRVVTAELPASARDSLLAVHAEAAAFFRRHLDGSWVPLYLRGRGLAAALDPPWDAGHAPPGWTTLVTHLRRQGVDDDTLLASGLAIRARTGRLVDTFRERLMLPVVDDAGRVVGFVGRAHPDASTRTPRYLNSPSTALYAKGRHLFGVHAGSAALRGGALPVLVEGPLDAVAVTTALAERGVGLAVCGTALTEAHLDHLTAHVDLPRTGIAVGFDTDPAGHQAAAEAAVLFGARGVVAVGAEWADCSDPSQLLQRHGPAELTLRVLDGAVPLDDLIVDRRLARWEKYVHVAEGRVGAARAAAHLIAGLPDGAVERQSVRIASRLGLEPRVVTDEVACLRMQAQDAAPPASRGITSPSGSLYRRAASSRPRSR